NTGVIGDNPNLMTPKPIINNIPIKIIMASPKLTGFHACLLFCSFIEIAPLCLCLDYVQKNCPRCNQHCNRDDLDFNRGTTQLGLLVLDPVTPLTRWYTL